MSDIKLSVLREKKARINGSRKSKGKFSFVQKIKYFYLRFKYAYVGVESFSDNELDAFLELLNMREETYTSTVESFEKEKQEIDNDLADKYEQIGSMDPQQYQTNGAKQLLDAASDANDDKEYLDKKIANTTANIRAVNRMKDVVEAEMETRDIDRAVDNSQELDEEIIKETGDQVAAPMVDITPDAAPQPVEEPTKVEPVQEEVKEEPTKVEQPEDKKEEENVTEEEFTANLKKSLEGLNNEIDNDADKAISEDAGDLGETPIEPAAPAFAVNMPTTEPLITPNSPEPKADLEAQYKKMLDDFNASFSDRTQLFNASINESIAKLSETLINNFAGYINDIGATWNKYVDSIMAKNQEVLETAMREKDSVIASKELEIAEKTRVNDQLTDDLTNATNTIAERDKTIEDLNTTIDGKNKDISDRDDDIAKLTQDNNNKAKEIEDLNAIVDKKEEDIRKKDDTIAERNGDILKLNERMAFLEKQLEELKTQLDEANKREEASKADAVKRAAAIQALLNEVGGVKPAEPTEGGKTM